MIEHLEGNKTLEYWTHLFYFIASPRNDGTAPTLEKAVDGRLFLTYEEADIYLRALNEELRAYYKVFHAIAVIPRMPPVTKEVGNDLDWPYWFQVELTVPNKVEQ